MPLSLEFQDGITQSKKVITDVLCLPGILTDAITDCGDEVTPFTEITNFGNKFVEWTRGIKSEIDKTPPVPKKRGGP
jgi:hypothetical protein